MNRSTIQTVALLIAAVSLLFLLKGILFPIILPLAGLWLAWKLFRYSQRK